MQPSAPSKLETPQGTAHAIIGSLATGKTRYHVNGEPVDIDVTIPDDLKDFFYWFGSLLVWDVPPGKCGLSICANTFPPPLCFEMVRDWLRRERAQESAVIQEKMF